MKRFLNKCLAALLLAALAVSLAAGVVPAFAATKPKSVSLDHTGTVTLVIGAQLVLTPILNPIDAATSFSWKSSKKKIASVSNGVVTAKKVGTTTISVTTSNKKKAKVKVKVIDPYKPNKVILNVSGTQTMLVSNALQLVAALDPITAQSTLKWKSSNKKVAIVDQNGLVGALAPGKTTITVTTHNNKKASVKIRVIDDGNQPIVPPAGYNLPYVIYACKNTHTIAIIAQDQATGLWNRVLRLFPTGMGRKNVTDVGFFYLAKKERWHKWGSGYSPYANRLSVGIYLHGPIYKQKNHHSIRPEYYNCIGKDCSSGCLRTTCACAAWVYYNCPVGTMVIVAQNSRFSTPRPTKISKKATTDPTDPGSNFEIFLTGFTVAPSAMTLNQGDSQQIGIANIIPANTSTPGFIFASSDNAVATVSASGVVTGVGPGTANITVSGNDDYRYTVVIPVTVNGAQVYGAESVAEADAAAQEAAAQDFAGLESPSDEDNGLTAEETPVTDETPVDQEIPVAVEADGEAPADDIPVEDVPAEDALEE